MVFFIAACIVTAIVAVAVVVIIIVAVTFPTGANSYTTVKVKQKKGYSPKSGMTVQLQKLYDAKHMLPSNIQRGRKLGSGFYGEVFAARLIDAKTEKQVKVAAKMMKSQAKQSATSIREFFEEALIMKDFNHPHVLVLVGIVWEEDGPYMIITPRFERGNLLDVVKSKHHSNQALRKYAKDIATGMEYLSGHGVVHRDLALRNCLVREDWSVAVGDYGLTRKTTLEYYFAQTNRPLPCLWLAPECIESMAKFSSKSDVWAFGVVLWELYSGGSDPTTPARSMDKQLQWLSNGNRLSAPKFMPSDIARLMSQCWCQLSSNRPNFSQIKKLLAG